MGEPVKKDREPVGRARRIGARWVPRDLDPILAEHAHLSRLNDQYYLTFGQLRVPVTDLTDPDESEITAEIRPVVTVVVSVQVLKNIAELLNKNLREGD